MSIIGLALRMSAVRALTGATLAGARVFDSAILPIDALLTADPAPFIAVSTEDDDTAEMGVSARTVQLVLEVGLSKAVTVDSGDGQTQVAVAIPDTDAGLELSLALLCRQIDAVLWGRGGGAWGSVFRNLTQGTRSVASRRGASMSDKGLRVAARLITYGVTAIAEPPLAQPVDPKSPLAPFLTQLAADPVTAPVAAAIRDAIEGAPADWPAIYTVSAMLAGLSEESALGIGIAALPPGAPGTPVIEIGALPHDGRPITPADADAQLPEKP